MLLVGSVLLVAAVTVASIMGSRADELLRNGLHVTGTITGTGAGTLREGSITVEYDVGGERQRQQINLDSDAPEYAAGQSVELIVDPRDPTRVRTVGESNDPAWGVLLFCFSVPTGLLLLPMGATVLARSRRWRRRLLAEPWRIVPVRVVETRRGRVSWILVHFADADGTVTRALTSTWNWRLRHIRGATELHVCGPFDDRVLVAPMSHATLMEVYRSRLSRRRRRWEATAE